MKVKPTLVPTMKDSPPKPQFTVSIGVIGHRPNRLPDEALSTVTLQIHQVLTHLFVAAEKTLSNHRSVFASEQVYPRLISALAEGADRMAAEAAIEKDFELFAILPFASVHYEKDFETQSSIADYRALIGKAARVLELCASRRPHQSAYETAGLTILENSDIILAVWDGGVSAGPGGTTDLLGEAARRGLPIIHIDAVGKNPPRLLWGGLRKYPLTGVDLDDLPVLPLVELLSDVLGKLVSPPSAEPTTRAHNKLLRFLSLILRLTFGKREPTTLKDFFEERPRRWNLRVEFPLLLGLLGVRFPIRSDIRPEGPDISSATFFAPVANAPTDFIEPTRGIMAPLSGAYGWADHLANQYAQMYRSAYVSNFILVALAGILGAAPLIFDWPQSLSYALRFVGAFLFVALVVNTFAGNFRNWHQRSIEARAAAEQLRFGLPISLLGEKPRSLARYDWSWIDWYVHTNYRALGICPGILNLRRLSDIKAILMDLLEDQALYHTKSAVLMTRIEQRLFAASMALLIVLGVLGYFWEEIELLAVIVLLALSAAFFGIRATGDFEGRAARSDRTATVLRELREAMESEAVTLSNLRARAQSIYRIMLDENEQWRVATQSRPLANPG